MKLKYFSISIVILFILCSVSQAKSKSETGYVLLTGENRVYIDQGSTNGVRVGAIFSVYGGAKAESAELREYPLPNGEQHARIEVVEVFEKGSAAELLTTRAQVEVGNRIKPYVKSVSPISPIPRRSKPRRIPAWFSLTVGIASGSGAAYCHWSDNISNTKKYDREKWILTGTSGVALATALFLFIRGNSNQSIRLNNSPERIEAEVYSIIRRTTTDGSPYVVLLNHVF